MSGTGKCPRGCIHNCIVFQDKCVFPFAPSGLGLRPFPEMSGTVFEQKGTKNQEN